MNRWLLPRSHLSAVGPAVLRAQADPDDAVFFRHGMKNAAHLYRYLLPVCFHHRQMLFSGRRRSLCRIWRQRLKGMAAVRKRGVRGALQRLQKDGSILIRQKYRFRFHDFFQSFPPQNAAFFFLIFPLSGIFYTGACFTGNDFSRP